MTKISSTITRYIPVLTLVLTGCATLFSNPWETELNTIEKAPSSSKNYPFTQRFEPMPLQVGQYAQYFLKKDQEKMALRLEVIQKGDVPYSFWLEVEFLTPKNKTFVFQQLMLDEAVIATKQQQQTENTEKLSDYKQVLKTYILTNTQKKPERVTPSELKKHVPEWGNIVWTPSSLSPTRRKQQTKAGNFQCYTGKSTFTLFNLNAALEGCFDSQVPLTGLVWAKLDTGHTLELIAFGAAGSSQRRGINF